MGTSKVGLNTRQRESLRFLNSHKMAILTIALLATLFAGCLGQSITAQPSNTSVLLGNNATLYCEVTGTQIGGDDLIWRKLETGGGSTFIGSNLNVNNATKYASVDKYRLYVFNTELIDEAEYQCSLTPDSYTAYISVNVAPTSITLKWPNNQDWTQQDQTANLTCTAGTSRPPATFRWFKDGTEITNQATVVSVTTDSDGYGAGMSVLTQTPSSSDEGAVYQCIADVPAQTGAQTASLTLTFSGAGHVLASFSVIGLAFLASLL